MQLYEYIYNCAREIINMEKINYEMYLRNDPHKSLTTEDFAHYSNIELKLRLCLLDGFLNDKMLNRKLKINDYEYGIELGKGIVAALRNYGYDESTISKLGEELGIDLEGYKDFIIKNSSIFPKIMPVMNYIFFYFSDSILSRYKDLNDKTEKGLSFGGLLKTNEKMLLEYLETSYKKVKIIN